MRTANTQEVTGVEVRGAKKKSLSPSVRVSFPDICCVRYGSFGTRQRLSSLPVAYGNLGAQNALN